jgi:uncharacterized membrane protein
MKAIALYLLAAAMTGVGIAHFVAPDPFVKIVPKQLPAPKALVYVSGFFEIAGGLGLLWGPTRVAAAWGLVALFIAVFPANVNQAMNAISFDDARPIPRVALWCRLPFQALFIAWAWWMTTA